MGATGEHRAMLAWIEEILEVSGFGPQHPIRVRWVEDAEEIVERVSAAVREAVVGI